MIYAEIVAPTVREHVRRYQAAREREKGVGEVLPKPIYEKL